MERVTREAGALVGPTVFAVVLFAVLTAGAASAQTTGTATLVGTVTDPSGSAVPRVQVAVVNTDTSFRSETTTGPDGNYTIPYLSPGTYQLTMEAAGFKRYVREGLVIRTAETPRVDVVLAIGATTESITVSAGAPLLATETALAGQVLEGSTVVRIPVQQTAASRMLYYFPTVISSQNYHIDGQRLRGIGFSIDGVSAKEPGTATFGDNDEILQISPEGIQEAKVTTNGFSAEYGHLAGGGINIVTKSGTNEYHGSLGDQYVWKSLAHRGYLDQFPFDNYSWYYDWFNGSFSGPVFIPKLYHGKNRTFFLTTLRGFFQLGGVPASTVTVPTSAMLNGDFSFGGAGFPIYNPYTIRQNASGTWTSDPFPNNQIPKNLFDPAVQKFLANNPFTPPNQPGIPTATGPQQNLIANTSKHIHRWSWDEKIDHQFTSNHKIVGRYSAMWEPTWINTTFAAQLAWRAIDLNSQNIPTATVSSTVSDTYILSPTRFNEFRIGYNRRANSAIQPTYGQDWAGKLGIPNVSPDTFPFFNIGYGLAGLPQSRTVGEDLSLQDNFTQIKGLHTIKAGYEVVRTRLDMVQPSLPSGTYNFGGTQLPFTPNTGNSFADFLVGSVSSASFTAAFADYLPRWWQHALYLQDDWKIRRNLTLNIGVRWSYESPFRTKYGQQSQFDPTVVDPLTGKMGAVTHPTAPLAKGDWNNFQPRVGLAWNFHPKWVFRSSFGIMTQDMYLTSLASQNFQEYVGTANVQQAPGNPTPAFFLSKGPPSISYPLQSNGTVPYVGSNYSARTADWYDPNMRAPYIMMWSGGFQYQFLPNWLAEVLYEGSAGVGLLENWNINQIPLNISTNPTVLNQIYQAPQNYRPYPQFGTINLYSNFGHNTHHAGTVRVEKRYAVGLTVLETYTFEKTRDDCDADGTCTGVDYYNRRLEKARAGYDITHHFLSTATYDFPFGRGRRFLNRGGVLNRIVGEWNGNWNMILESGPPTSVTFAGSPNRYLTQGVYRPNAVAPGSGVTPDWTMGPNRFPSSAQNPYLNINAFAYPAAFTVGTLGRNTYEAPGMVWMQFSLFKSFTIRERFKFTLRADGNNFPYANWQLTAPNSAYNLSSALTFGRFTAERGTYAGIGNQRPHVVLGARIDF
jgi:Carboxypeptidase regulatory-like domain